METTVVKLRSNAVKIQGCNTTTTDDSCCNVAPSPRPPPPTQRENNHVISLADVDIVEVSETGRRFSGTTGGAVPQRGRGTIPPP